MPGPVALVGAGEFLPSMADFDRLMLDATGVPRPRVAIVPTAAFLDGEEAFHRRAARGVEHFSALGADVEAVLVGDRADAHDTAHAQAVGEADLIYFTGGRPGHLVETLEESALWAAARAAHVRGAILAGCSAGAMILAEWQAIVRRPMLPFPMRWRRALGVVAGAVVFPHYDTWPETLVAVAALQAPRGAAVLGLDEETAMFGGEGSWQVHGRARVTIWQGRRRERHRAGDVFRI